MYKQSFKTEELKEELERRLGFELKSFVRIRGGGAINFKAERASDGLPFLVKCYSPDRADVYERLSATLEIMEGVKTPTRLFVDRYPLSFGEHLLMCLTWQSGSVMDPDQLTDEQWDRFVVDYMRLSERMQLVRTSDVVCPVHDLWESARAACCGVSGYILRPVLERLNEDELDFRPESIRIVHGDFHRGNLLFSEGTLRCFMDLESLRKGYSAEDICGLLMIGATKLKKSRQKRLPRFLSLFRRAVRALPYSPREWRTAINAIYVKKVHSRTNGFRNMGPLKSYELVSIAKVADRFRQQI